MISTQYINLDMIPSGVLPVLYCSQYDIGRPLGMVVYNRGEAVNLNAYTCTIEATRTDGTAITAAVTTDGNIGVFVTTATMTNKRDKYQAKLVLFDSQSRRVASLAFIMRITPATMDENAESIEEDASLYQQYTGTVQSLIAGIREDITGLDTRLTQEESARAALDDTVQKKRDIPATDVTLDGKITSDTYMQGGCYTENGRFVIYIAENGTDYGVLQCVDSTTHEIVWTSARLQLYHANAIAFRPADRKLYIAPCYTESDASVLLNTIIVVDYDTHTIERTIASPAPGGIYSLAYDAGTDTFYSTNYRGTTEGQANALYKYDGVFESLNSTVILDDMTVRGDIVSSSQGVQCVADGIAYIPYYTPNKCIVGYSLEDGSRVSVSNLPRTTNLYRNVGEPEFVAFDGNDFYFGFMSVNTGIPGHVFWSICKVGIYHNIVVNTNLPGMPSVSNDQWNTTNISLHLYKPDLKPTSQTGVFYSLSDIIRYQKMVQIYFNVLVRNTADPDDLFIGHIYASEFNATIRPYDNTKQLRVERAIFSASNINWQWCTFVGTSTDNTIKANLLVARMSHFCLQFCQFEETEGNTHAIFVYLGGSIEADIDSINTSYYVVGATTGKVVNNSTSQYPKFYGLDRLDITYATELVGVTVRIAYIATMTVGTAVSIPKLVNKRETIIYCSRTTTASIVSTAAGVSSFKAIIPTDNNDGFKIVAFSLNVNSNTLTLDSVSVVTPNGVTSENTLASVNLLQR